MSAAGMSAGGDRKKHCWKVSMVAKFDRIEREDFDGAEEEQPASLPFANSLAALMTELDAREVTGY